MRAPAAWFLASALISAGCTHGYETYVAELDGALEGVTTNARGRAILLLSREGDRADITLSVTGFTSAITGSFVRRAPRGQTGPPVYTLWLPSQEPFGNDAAILRVWGAEAPAGGVTFDAAMLSELRAGNLYVNVQTRDRPSGEVRGQLLPE